MRCLVTGAAGFIGYHVSKTLLNRGHQITGVDNLNDYYDVRLKEDRLKQLVGRERFNFCRLDLADRQTVAELFADNSFDVVIHLAAQAGVRNSLTNPHVYADSNLIGFLNILEGCRANLPQHLIYASSSSVYGANRKVPFSVGDPVDHPMSLYAASKRSNELMAETYSHLFHIPSTGLRFFTVYGPWGRPDMALYKFTKAILARQPIEVFNHGRLRRDFTYIDDIVDGICRVVDQGFKQLFNCPSPQNLIDAASPKYRGGELGTTVPAGHSEHRIFNIGNNQPVELEHLIATLEKSLGVRAIKKYLEMQPGDVFETYADIDPMIEEYGFRPSVKIEEGVSRFTEWYLRYTQQTLSTLSRAA